MAAAGVAAVNTIAHLGTGVANSMVGVIRDQTPSFALALTPLAVLTLCGSITIVIMGRMARKKAG
jgi:hypothetical protein